MGQCDWACVSPLDQQYHDLEWGVPVHDDRQLFEFLSLEALQCGLSWSLILKKRDILRSCFDGSILTASPIMMLPTWRAF